MRHDLIGAQILDVRHQQELAIHGTRQDKRIGVDIIGKELTFKIHPDDAPQMRFSNRMIKPLGRCWDYCCDLKFWCTIICIDLDY